MQKRLSKTFAEQTKQRIDSYHVYKHRNDGRFIPLQQDANVFVNNSFVFPYNLWLLLKYDYYIIVEGCSSIKSIKYLYKYVYKGPNCVTFEVHQGPNYDEVSQYVDGRWAYAPEAM